ncbi:MAG: serine hydrolase domain-containing protein [Planctomycetota bacterium]
MLARLAALAICLLAVRSPVQAPYWPARFDEWNRVTPREAGFDPERLNAAIQFAESHFDPRGGFDPSREPYGEIIGPTKAPSGMNGLILIGGRIAAEWGDTFEVDMTFSVTKTYLSTVAGLAVSDGLVRSVDDPVRSYVPDGAFDVTHNRGITWHQLLNQTSGFEGTLWGKPDWADRYDGKRRGPDKPGEHWRYNDVRVNALALALLHVYCEPLPAILRDRIMDPIGCSRTWRWYGYENSFVTIDGQSMQSVSGGGHWGGGMFISTRDQALFGLLMLRGGKRGDVQLVQPEWIARARTPTPQNPVYGYMNWFLNGEQHKLYPSAPAGDVFFVGAGTNLVWLSYAREMLVVVRWLDRKHVDAFLGKVLAAFE